MSNNDETARNSGGAEAFADKPQLELDQLPTKLRVHALAKLLSVSSKDVITALAELGESARSAQSSVSRDTAIKVAETLNRSVGAASSEVDTVSTRPATILEAPRETVQRAALLTPLFAPPSAMFLAPTVKESSPRTTAEGGASQPKAATDEATTSRKDRQANDRDSRKRRRRGRRGRGRGRGTEAEMTESLSEADTEAYVTEGSEPTEANRDETSTGQPVTDTEPSADFDAEAQTELEDQTDGKQRRRRRRRRKNDDAIDETTTPDDPPNTVVHVRQTRQTDLETETDVRRVRGSTRLEAKRQHRRDSSRARVRRRPIVLSEAEFLARREAVSRTMVVRERADRVQIGVLEDDVLVEHFVTTTGRSSLVGNVYLGRVQNVLPGMEAAFIDIGNRGRNALLYAGEIDWEAAGLQGDARKIEQALSPGDTILVQITKEPIGHKGARLTTQINLPGRFLVYLPGGGVTGISRKLPENERARLKEVLREIMPEDAGVIIRTASEGVTEQELKRDVARLEAQWQVIKSKAEEVKDKAPQLLYEEPDLLVKVVRDLFTEDFSELIVEGSQAWDTINAYVQHVAPDLTDRLRRHVDPTDVFAAHRIDEQILKALDRKVWLKSGGYLIIDRTEAMTVIDVNTGKFTGAGGNLEETVTRNNLESAEEIVRQLRLRDIGGIIVIDFIDMVLESNRELVLRRLTECLSRDRTRHQVAEVTSLGLVQMTRKRVGAGLLEAFSVTCEHCRGRGVMLQGEFAHVHEPSYDSRGFHGNNAVGGDSPAKSGSQAEEKLKTTSRREPIPAGLTPAKYRDHSPTDEVDDESTPVNSLDIETSEPVILADQEVDRTDRPARRNRKDRRQRRKARRDAAAANIHPEAITSDAPSAEASAITDNSATKQDVEPPTAGQGSTEATLPATPAVQEPAAANDATSDSATTAALERTVAENPATKIPAVPSRRPRRVASRPAGPPVSLQSSSPESDSESQNKADTLT